MSANQVCPKCESQEIIPGVRILDRTEAGNMAASDLTAVVYENPDALLFKGGHHSELRARVCGACGYAELFVTYPEELLAAYRAARARR
ncbi:MAG TPA: hypothetical protein VEQ42_08120 [Pyrinomonadaceae bacterium]|nr:hypothetical protein [Pyrinomonadaceae bacterium]